MDHVFPPIITGKIQSECEGIFDHDVSSPLNFKGKNRTGSEEARQG